MGINQGHRITLVEVTGLIMLLTTLRRAGLMEQRNGLLKSQLQCQLSDSTSPSLGLAPWASVYALSQHPTYGAVCPISKIHGSRIQGMGKGGAPLTITPRDQLARSWLPVPMTLYSASLGLLAPEGGQLLPGDTGDSAETEAEPATRPPWAPHWYLIIVNFTSQYLSFGISRRRVNVTQGLDFFLQRSCIFG